MTVVAEQQLSNEAKEGDSMTFCQLVVATIMPQEVELNSVVPDIETINFVLKTALRGCTL